MGIYKTFKNIDECENQVILKMARSDNNKFLGIRTQAGVIFFAATATDGKSEIVGVSYTDVPHSLLIELELEIGLVSTKDSTTNIRKI